MRLRSLCHAKVAADPHPVMYGMNSRLVKKDGVLQEEVWKLDGMYGEAIQKLFSGWKSGNSG